MLCTLCVCLNHFLDFGGTLRHFYCSSSLPVTFPLCVFYFGVLLLHTPPTTADMWPPPFGRLVLQTQQLFFYSMHTFVCHQPSIGISAVPACQHILLLLLLTNSMPSLFCVGPCCTMRRRYMLLCHSSFADVLTLFCLFTSLYDVCLYSCCCCCDF